MEGAALKKEMPIMKVTEECYKLYMEQLEMLSKEGREDTAEQLSLLYDQFDMWTKVSGVHAGPEVCLDRKLCLPNRVIPYSGYWTFFISYEYT